MHVNALNLVFNFLKLCIKRCRCILFFSFYLFVFVSTFPDLEYAVKIGRKSAQCEWAPPHSECAEWLEIPAVTAAGA